MVIVMTIIMTMAMITFGSSAFYSNEICCWGRAQILLLSWPGRTKYPDVPCCTKDDNGLANSSAPSIERLCLLPAFAELHFWWET